MEAENRSAATAAAFGWLPARFEREATAVPHATEVPASESSQTVSLHPHPPLGPDDSQEDGKREGQRQDALRAADPFERVEEVDSKVETPPACLLLLRPLADGARGPDGGAHATAPVGE